MIKLKEVIHQLNETAYNIVENKLVQTKAENFLYVLRSYKEDKISEEQIINNLSISSNSFYVLKSRLYDRIQDNLTIEINLSKSDVYTQLEKVHSICYNSSREISCAFLQKLEKGLLAYDMHIELLIIYSALKKLHYNTNKYFHYSQLYNKYVSFWLSLEKANDILNDFNLLLEQYNFSKDSIQIDKLIFLKKEIEQHFILNPSRQLEIIKNIIDIQLFVFCNVNTTLDIPNLLQDTLEKIKQLPESSPQKTWDRVLHYLSFEYYNKSGQTNKAEVYYEKTNQVLHNLLLFSNICLVANFMTSKINYLSSRKKNYVLEEIAVNDLLYNNTMHSQVQIGLYKAISLYNSGEIKKAITTLNDLLNTYILKDYFHVCMEIKFTIAFFYLKLNEYDRAESLIVSIYKKLKTDKLTQYSNALDLIKFFNTFFKLKKTKANEVKRQEALILFFARNKGKYEMLYFLQTELNNNYLKQH